MNIKKTLDKAIIPEQGVQTTFKVAALGTGVGRDGRVIIEYKAGLSVEIPTGYVGIITPLDTIFFGSLMMPSSVVVLNEGWNDIICRFKINTDSIPSIYEEGEDFCKMILVPITGIEFNEVVEVEVSKTELDNQTEDESQVPE
jgi:dUTPase